jgi:hypothetical protein
MSITSALDNPIERLGILPNAMNWRGGWLATEQYYQNDVVISPVNNASYILNGVTALLGGVDPTINPDWIELSSTSTGVLQVNAGAGIIITGTGTVPVINNDGVITLTTPPSSGITIGGSAQNPTVSNSGVITLINGPGIAITGSPNVPIISNNGVVSVTAGSGIQIGGGDPKNPIVVNDGVLSVASAGTGITVTGGTGPNPTIQNDGVLTVAAGSGVTITGTAQNPIISATSTPSTLTVMNLFTNVPIGGSALTIPATGSLNVTAVLLSPFIVNAFANGTGDPNGTFVFDFHLTFYTSGLLLATAQFDYTFSDGTNNYLVPATEGGEQLVLFGFTTCVFTMNRLVVPLSNIRGSGVTNITRLIITNNTTLPFTLYSAPLTHCPVYYPDGIQ